MAILIRRIEPNDNPLIAELIKEVFREFKIDKPGTVYSDPSTNHLYQLFQAPKSGYWIAEEDGRIIGGCGFYPTAGLPEGCAELVKFYLSPEARGKGTGRQLLEMVCHAADEAGYRELYLESFPELATAVRMYEKAGFRNIDKPLGNSGHFACTIWMVKKLNRIEEV
jgi:putative acetyltransferase